MTEEIESTIYLSEFVKKLMHKVMIRSNFVQQGFIFFNHRIIVECEIDTEPCDRLLETMIINKENVIRYLRRKYIPTYVTGGAVFRNQKCIQKAMVDSDGSMIIHIAKSEPHKIITDTIHVKSLLEANGLHPTNKVKFFIDQVQIAYQDTLLYNLLLKEFGFQVPSMAREYERRLLMKYGKFEEIVKIKKRSVKRKFLRYRVKKGEIDWKQLRRCINIEDYSMHSVKKLCNEIRAEQALLGIIVR